MPYSTEHLSWNTIKGTYTEKKGISFTENMNIFEKQTIGKENTMIHFSKKTMCF